MKLNGWKRLYIVIVILYSAIVFLLGYEDFPKLEDSYHRDAFFSQMSKKSQDMIEQSKSGENGITVEMPNNAIIPISNKLTETEQNALANEYWAVVENYTKEQQNQYLKIASIFWLVPCVLLYALGMAVAWIIRGFRR